MAKVFVYNDHVSEGVNCSVFKMPTPVSIFCEPKKITCLNIGESENEISTNIAYTIATRINNHHQDCDIMAASFHDEDLFWRYAYPQIMEDYNGLLTRTIKKALSSIQIKELPVVPTWDRDFIVQVRDGIRNNWHHLMVKGVREDEKDMSESEVSVRKASEGFQTLVRSIGCSILGCWISVNKSVRRCDCLFLAPRSGYLFPDMVRFYYRKGEIKSRRMPEGDDNLTRRVVTV